MIALGHALWVCLPLGRLRSRRRFLSRLLSLGALLLESFYPWRLNAHRCKLTKHSICRRSRCCGKSAALIEGMLADVELARNRSRESVRPCHEKGRHLRGVQLNCCQQRRRTVCEVAVAAGGEAVETLARLKPSAHRAGPVYIIPPISG